MAVWEEGKRKWQPREMQMASEFIAANFPGASHATRVHLGMPHPELVYPGMSPEEIRLLRVYSRWADAVVYLRDKVILVECKIRPRLGPTEALDLYARLFKKDPDYKEHWHKPLEKWLIYAVEDPVLTMIAQEKGIKCVQYVPAWTPEYLRILQSRERRGPLTAIEE